MSNEEKKNSVPVEGTVNSNTQPETIAEPVAAKKPGLLASLAGFKEKHPWLTKLGGALLIGGAGYGLYELGKRSEHTRLGDIVIQMTDDCKSADILVHDEPEAIPESTAYTEAVEPEDTEN